MSGPVVIRRRVPNDHSCLFWGIAYLAEPTGEESSRSKARELRDICANDALHDADPVMRALLLGAESVEEYATWIRNEMHWGGENEIVALAKHYKLEIGVVNCESLTVLCYGSENQEASERVYLLYTGQHYDPLVAADQSDAMPAAERRRFVKGDASLEAAALETAREHNREAAKRAAQRRVKRIKCGGCGALLDGNDAFAAHCGEVEHGDDFAYDCEEVEVVIEEGEALPEGTIDLSSENVHSFYGVATEPLSRVCLASISLGGVSYATLEHHCCAAPLVDAELAKRVAEAATVSEAIAISSGAGPDAMRPGWYENRATALLEAVRAKAAQHSDFAAALLATGKKTLVSIETDPWAGMQSPGGIPTGQNHYGKALMTVREELSKLA